MSDATITWDSLTEDQRIALHLLYHDCGCTWKPGKGQPRLCSDALMLELMQQLVQLGLVMLCKGGDYAILVPGIEIIPDKDVDYEAMEERSW